MKKNVTVGGLCRCGAFGFALAAAACCAYGAQTPPDPLDVPGAVEAVDPAPKKVTKRICLLENGDIGKYWYTWLKKHQQRNVDPDRVFTAEGTTLKVSGTDMGCVTTRDAYRDYRLTLEFRYVDNDVQLNKKAARDGGILFHSNGPDGAYGNGIWMYSFEYNVIQGASGDLIVVGNRANRPDAPHFSCKGNVDAATKGKPSQHWDPNGPEIELKDGGRVRRCDVDLDWQNLKTQPLSPNENPIGEWNRAEVVCKGDTAVFFFNGKKVAEFRELKPSAGRIQLQSEGFGIEYRNIVLEPAESGADCSSCEGGCPVAAAVACAEKEGFDLNMLLGLMRIPSVTSNIEENNRAISYLADWFGRHGVFTAVRTNEVGRTVLYASTTPGKCHDIVFVTHVDVVPPLADGQFSPVIKGDLLYGRGACDTKGNVAVIAQALANLAGKGSFGAVFATDEEGRSQGLNTPTVLLNHGFIPQKFLIVGDTNCEHMDSLTIAEKGHAHLKLVAHGKGGHSSIPWVSDNPIPKLNEGYAKILAAFPKPSADEDHWRDYLTATRLFGSEANNIIPDTASMNFSYRFIEPDGPQKMKAFIEKLTGLEVVLPETWRPPVISDPNNPYISSLFAEMCRKWPDRNIRYTKMSCATDATRYVHLKLPTVIFGANGYGAHASDERVSLRSLYEYAQMFTTYLKSQIR